jgi:hypothetical protein
VQNFKEYLEKELQDAGLSDPAITAALEKLATHDKLSPRLNALVKTATEDYQAQVGRVNAARAAQERLEYLEKEWWPDYSKQVNAQAEELATLRSRGSTGLPSLPAGFDPSKVVTKEDLAAALREQAGNYARVIKDTGRLASRHAAEFGEALDVDGLDKLATERKVSLPEAYEALVGPRLEERRKLKAQEDEKKLRDEITRDVMTRFNLPATAVEPDVAPMYARPPADGVGKGSSEAELLATWTQAGAGRA